MPGECNKLQNSALNCNFYRQGTAKENEHTPAYDAVLAELAALWPDLSESARDALLTMARALAGKGPGGA